MEKKINVGQRKAIIYAMDVIARSLGEEAFVEEWLECGIEDGRINHAFFEHYFESLNFEDDFDAFCIYCDDDILADIMSQFLRIICNSCDKNVSMEKRVGVLCCDGVISESEALKFKEKV